MDDENVNKENLPKSTACLGDQLATKCVSHEISSTQSTSRSENDQTRSLVELGDREADRIFLQ